MTTTNTPPVIPITRPTRLFFGGGRITGGTPQGEGGWGGEGMDTPAQYCTG